MKTLSKTASAQPLSLIFVLINMGGILFQSRRGSLWLFLWAGYPYGGMAGLTITGYSGSFILRVGNEDLQPVILNSILLSGAAIQAFFGPTKKNTFLRLKMNSQCQLRRSIAYVSLESKCFIFYCYIICISSCASAKQITAAYRIQWSTALRENWRAQPVKTITLMFAGDLRYRTQQVPAKLANIAASIL